VRGELPPEQREHHHGIGQLAMKTEQECLVPNLGKKLNEIKDVDVAAAVARKWPLNRA